MVHSIFTHQCSCMSIPCATLLHATNVFLISMTNGQHHHVIIYADMMISMDVFVITMHGYGKHIHADKSSGGSC